MKAGASGRDKRKFDRIRITDSKCIWNLSVGGAYIATDNPKRLGSTIVFEYSLTKTEPPLRVLAKVIRVLHKPNPKIGEPAGMAIQFLDVSAQDIKRLDNYLKACRERARIEGIEDAEKFWCPPDIE